MKRLFTLFLVLAASINLIWAETAEINGVYYNLDPGTKTAGVTAQKEKNMNIM